MAVNIGSVAQAGLLPQQYPPPLFPKPGKENVRLQKLLKKTAKKKAASQASQTPVPFRSSLSPVNEASPDLEHSDHSTPPKTPETPIYGGTLHPRFNVRPVYHHSASPYPHHRGVPYGKPARFSPQPYVTPGLTVSHHVAPLFSYTTPPHPVPSYAATSVTVTSVTAITTTTEIIRPADTKPGAAQVSAAVKHINNVVLATKLEPNSSLTPTFIISKALSPQLSALEDIKPSKPMFDVPRITNYTSKTTSLRTSYYASSPTLERSKTPLPEVMRGPTPTFEVRRIVTPTSELKRDKTPTREIRRGATPTPEIKRGTTPTSEIKRGATPTFENKRGPTPTSEIKRGATPTPEIKKGTTPTPEIKRGTTPTPEIKRGTTPTPEIKRGTTPTPEIKRGTTPTPELKRGSTPTPEIKSRTPTLEIKRGATPTSEIKSEPTVLIEPIRGRTPTRDRAPTFEILALKTSSGRPKTPSYHVSPARTPVIEISRPNPLLFAVSPVHMEGRRSKTPTSGVLGPSDEIPKEKDEPKENGSSAKQNGEVQMKSDDISADKMPPESIKELPKPKPVHESPKLVHESPKPVHESPKHVPSTVGYQSSKTSNQEFPQPAIFSPGHQRPRVPPFAGQRPRTPTSKSKSAYYGLTPAEYVAYGGIQSYTPAFSMLRSLSPSAETSKVPEQEPQEHTQNGQGKAKEQSSLKETTRPEIIYRETETTKTPVSEIPLSPNAEVPMSKAAAPSEVSEPRTPTMETKLKPVQETLMLPTPDIKKVKVEVPVMTIPTIVVSKVETPPSETPTAVTAVPVTQRVRTPTYGPSKPKTPPPDSVTETTKLETKPTPPSKKGTTPDKNADTSKPTPAETAITTKINKVSKKPSASGMSLLERVKGLKEQKPEKAAPEKTKDEPLVKATDDQKDKVKPEKADLKDAKKSTEHVTPAGEEKVGNSSLPTTEPLLKVIPKPKATKSKFSGWSRLKKHMVVEAEEPMFPEPALELKKDAPNGAPQSEEKKQVQKAEDISEKSQSQDAKDSPRAAKMWDAVLFQMFSTKESIMQQIEANKTEEQKKEDAELNKETEIPSFAHRLPVLLYSPRFDARKLREAASRPVTKIATVFEMSLIGRKNKDEEPKDFNRTARGFGASKTSVAEE